MENQIQISSSESYFLEKKQSVSGIINLPTKTFLQQSYNFQKLSEIKKDPNFVLLIGGWITQTSAIMQIKNPVDNFVKQDIVNMLGGFWSTLSFEEIVMAFEMERYGLYGEKTEHFQLFDCNYIAQVFKKYKKWKAEKKIELNISQQKIVVEKTEEEKFNLMTEAINRKYNDFKNENEIDEPLGYIFDELVLRGLIYVPEDESSPYWKYYIQKNIKARKIIEVQLKNQPSQSSMERNQIKKELETLINGKSSKVDLMVKKLILIDFFTKAKSENKESIC